MMEYMDILNKSKQLLISKGYDFVQYSEIGEVNEPSIDLNQVSTHICYEINKFIDPAIASPEFNSLLSDFIATSFLDMKSISLVIDNFIIQKPQTNDVINCDIFYKKCHLLIKISFLMSTFWALTFDKKLDTLLGLKIDPTNGDLKNILISTITDIRITNRNAMEYLNIGFKLRNLYGIYSEEQSCRNIESKYILEWLKELIAHEKNYEFQWWPTLSQSLNLNMNNINHNDVLKILNDEMKQRRCGIEKLKLTENETKKINDKYKILMNSIGKFKKEVSAICKSLENVEKGINDCL